MILYKMTSNRVNAHLKRAHDLLKQSAKGFGVLPIRPIKQMSIYLDGLSNKEYHEMMQKWENNSTIQSLKDSIQDYLRHSYRLTPRLKNHMTLTMAHGTAGGATLPTHATLDFEYNVDDLVHAWDRAELHERISMYPRYVALHKEMLDEEGIKLVTDAVNESLARSGDKFLMDVKVTQVFENSHARLELLLFTHHRLMYPPQDSERVFPQNG